MEAMSDLGLLIQFAYVVSGGLFIYGLKLLGSADSARRGNMLSAGAMLLAIAIGCHQGAHRLGIIAAVPELGLMLINVAS